MKWIESKIKNSDQMERSSIGSLLSFSFFPFSLPPKKGECLSRGRRRKKKEWGSGRVQVQWHQIVMKLRNKIYGLLNQINLCSQSKPIFLSLFSLFLSTFLSSFFFYLKFWGRKKREREKKFIFKKYFSYTFSFAPFSRIDKYLIFSLLFSPPKNLLLSQLLEARILEPNFCGSKIN